MAHEFIRVKKYDRALDVLREGYRSIPIDSLEYSQRTYYYWLRNVYKGFMIGKVTKDKEVISNSYRILSYYPNFFTLVACLQINSDYKACSNHFKWAKRMCVIGSGKERRFDLPIMYTPAMVNFFEKECGF